jgi:glycosyltransferase involved in cell wall biosynthesis
VPRPDVAVVAIDSTAGWRSATAELVAALEAAGARTITAPSAPVSEVRTLALTDFVQARAARAAAQRAIAEHHPKALIYCSVTAALLWPAPGAIWLDAVAAENRPGRHGIWQRPLEPRRLRQAPLLLAMSPRALDHATRLAEPPIVVRCPVEPSAPTPTALRDVDALMYAANPAKKRLAYVLDAWARARKPGETLTVAGIDRLDPAPGVHLAGRLAKNEYRALVRRAKVFVAAPTREDYGIAPLEALADGCRLVTTPAAGAYPALEIARRLDPRLVDPDLSRAIRTALDDPRPGYAEQAAALLAPFTRQAVTNTLAKEVLPRLLPGLRPE